MGPRHVDRALIAAFAAVVLSFTGATWFGQHQAGEIERAALKIHTEVAPRIQRLAAAKTELRHLQLLVHRALDERSPGRRIVEIQAGRALLDDAITEYQHVPKSAGGDVVWRDIASARSRVEADLTSILQDIGAGDLHAAQVTQDQLDASSERLAQTLSHAIDVNVILASTLAGRIEESHERGAWWAVLLDGAGVLLAVGAAGLALRVSRAHSRAVQAYRDVAERRADELEQFAARLAHDVRTPLAAIGLSLGLAQRYGGDDPRFCRAVERAQRAFTQTTRIIDALFEFARSGARPRPGACSSITEAAENVAAVMQVRADQIDAEIRVIADAQYLVPCSAGVLETAIGNLVGNALTYVDGTATRVVTIAIAEDADQITTTVSDTGPGLPPNVAAESLFEPYVRGERARGVGLGLGLATVRRIVEAHGGRAGVRSASKGCAFWFTLPRASAPPPRNSNGALTIANG